MLTIHELNLMINNHNEKIKNERKGGIITAFYSAYFQRIEKLSSDELERVLNHTDHEEKEMTDNDMFAVVKQISSSLGGGFN